MTDEQIRQVIEHVMAHGARSAMRRAIGDRTTAQFDRADAVAEGIAAGVRDAIEELGLEIREQVAA